jgi:hypothetical protein
VEEAWRTLHNDKVALRKLFPKYVCFPCHLFHPLFHTHHYPSSEAGTIGEIVIYVPSGLILTPPHEIEEKVTSVDRQTISAFKLSSPAASKIANGLNSRAELRVFCLSNDCKPIRSQSSSRMSSATRVVRKIRFPRSCSREERCYAGYIDTGV